MQHINPAKQVLLERQGGRRPRKQGVISWKVRGHANGSLTLAARAERDDPISEDNTATAREGKGMISEVHCLGG